MTKILHLAQSAGYGVTIYVESLIKGLANRGFEQVLLGSEYYNRKRFKSIVDKLVTIKMEREISPRDLEAIKECRRVIRQEKPDIVYCHSSKAGIYGRVACLGTKAKVVYNPHGWAFNMRCSFLKRIFYKAAETTLSLATDKIVVISNSEKVSTPWTIARRKLVTILNGIDIRHGLEKLRRTRITRKEVGLDETDFVIGLIARISVQKGQDLLVEIAKEVVMEIPNAKFLLVGGKSDDMPIEAMIDRAGMKGRFIITGEVEDAIMYATLFDVAILTSRWEGFGLVLPEYMLAKRPIVAFDVDAVGEVVTDGEEGLLVRAGDIQCFARSICKLYKDRQLRERMGEAGFRRASKHYDIKRVCEEHAALFQELTHRKNNQ